MMIIPQLPSSTLVNLLSLLQHLQLLRPDDIAEELAGQVEDRCGRDHHHKEHNPQGSVQHIQNWINPNARDVLDDVQPDQITSHEHRQGSDTSLTARILSE